MTKFNFNDQSTSYQVSIQYKLAVALKKYGYGILDESWNPISDYIIKRGALNDIKRLGITAPKNKSDWELEGLDICFLPLAIWTWEDRQRYFRTYIATLDFLPEQASDLDHYLHPVLHDGHPVINFKKGQVKPLNATKWRLEVY